jgi:hypothetical protein
LLSSPEPPPAERPGARARPDASPITGQRGREPSSRAYVPERDSFASWDLTDVTGGFTFDTHRVKLALGLGYAWGKNDLPQVVVPPDQAGTTPTREASFNRWTTSVGAAFHDK